MTAIAHLATRGSCGRSCRRSIASAPETKSTPPSAESCARRACRRTFPPVRWMRFRSRRGSIDSTGSIRCLFTSARASISANASHRTFRRTIAAPTICVFHRRSFASNSRKPRASSARCCASRSSSSRSSPPITSACGGAPTLIALGVMVEPSPPDYLRADVTEPREPYGLYGPFSALLPCRARDAARPGLRGRVVLTPARSRAAYGPLFRASDQEVRGRRLCRRGDARSSPRAVSPGARTLRNAAMAL